jgi:heterotetrameric sarcosine oxidase gamma subunit
MDDLSVLAVDTGVRVLPIRHSAFGVLRLAREASPITMAAIEAALGIAPPQAANQAVGAAMRVLRTGPLEWTLIDAPPERIAALQERIAGVLAHYADLTDARAGFQVAGEGAGRLIAAECPLDLDEAAFAPDQCAQSLFAGMPILVDRRRGESGFRLYVDISLAAHMASWLAAAAEGLA